MAALHEVAGIDLDEELHDDALAAMADADVTEWSREQMDRIIGAIGRVRAERAADEQVVRERIAAVEVWRDVREETRARREEHLVSMVTAWHEHLLRDDPKAKTVSLPSGTSKSRARQQSIKVVDADAFLKWAADAHRDDLIRARLTHSPDATAIKNGLAVGESQIGPVVVDANGEEVPGCIVEPAGRTFSIDTTTNDEVPA